MNYFTLLYIKKQKPQIFITSLVLLSLLVFNQNKINGKFVIVATDVVRSVVIVVFMYLRCIIVASVH